MSGRLDPAGIIDLLEEWSSRDQQRRLWLFTGESGAGISSFAEAQEQLFTDTGLGAELDRCSLVFGETIDLLLRQFRGLISRIDAERRPEEIIEDEAMSEVRAAAAALLNQLQR